MLPPMPPPPCKEGSRRSGATELTACTACETATVGEKRRGVGLECRAAGALAASVVCRGEKLPPAGILLGCGEGGGGDAGAERGGDGGAEVPCCAWRRVRWGVGSSWPAAGLGAKSRAGVGACWARRGWWDAGGRGGGEAHWEG